MGDPDSLLPGMLAAWLTVRSTHGGIEHAVLSDGWRRIRLDVEYGTLLEPGPIRIEVRMRGLVSAATKILPLRRLLVLCSRGSFAPALFPADGRARHWLLALRAHDASQAGASLREIGATLWPGDEWPGPGDATKSRARRLVTAARDLAAGGWRGLMRGRGSPPPPPNEDRWR